MTDTQIITMLSNGLTVKEISKEMGVTHRIINYRIGILKDRVRCVTLTQLVANYLRKGLIE